MEFGPSCGFYHGLSIEKKPSRRKIEMSRLVHRPESELGGEGVGYLSPMFQ
ncbi:unnamed protein product [Arabidopsis lyrata]|nr:unnamed protein product [Arabidopsis lyrata]